MTRAGLGLDYRAPSTAKAPETHRCKQADGCRVRVTHQSSCQCVWSV